MVPKNTRIILFVLIGLFTEILVADNLTTSFENHDFSSKTTTAFTTQSLPLTASKVEPENIGNVSSSKLLQDKETKAIYLSSETESSTASLSSSKNETLRTRDEPSTTSEPSNKEIRKEYIASDSESEIIAVSPVNVKPEISEESNEIEKPLSTIVTSTDKITADDAIDNEIVESGTSPDVSNIRDGTTTYSTAHLDDQNAGSHEPNSIASSTAAPDKENALHSAVKRDLVAKSVEKNITKDDSISFANVDSDNSSASTTIFSQHEENSKVPGLVSADSFSSENSSSTLMSITNEASTQSSEISQTSATEINAKNNSQLFETSQTSAVLNSSSTEVTAKEVPMVMQTADNGVSTTSKYVDVTKDEETTTLKVNSQDSTPYFNHDPSQIEPLVKPRGQKSSVSKSELVKDDAESISLESHDSTSSSSERPTSNAPTRSKPISTAKPTVDTHTSIRAEIYGVPKDVSLLDEKSLTNRNATTEHSSEDTESNIRVEDVENSEVPQSLNKDTSSPIDVSVDDGIHEAESSIIVVTAHDNSIQLPEHHQDELSTVKENSSHFIVTESKSKNNVSSADTLQNEGSSTEAALLIDSKLSDVVPSVPENKVSVDSSMLNASTFQVLEKGQKELVSLEDLLNSTSIPILREEKMLNDAAQPEDAHSVASNKDASSKEEHNIHDLNSVQHIPKEKGDAETHLLVSQSLGAATPEPTSKAAKESSARQPIVIQPTISGEELVTVIDSHIIGSTPQVSTSPVAEEKSSAHPTESEVSLQVLTSAVGNSNSSTDKHLNGDLVISDQITQNESEDIHNGSENILPNISQASDGNVAKAAVSNSPQIRKEIFNNTTDIPTVAFQPNQSNETTSSDTNSTSSELATSTPIVETTTVVVPAPPLVPKPKIRFTGDRAANRAPITRSKPKRPTPEDIGTVVSIFGKSRTRRPSITSSTTYGPPAKYSFNRDRPPLIIGTETIMFSLPPTTTPVTTTEAEEEEEEEETEEENIVGETISLNEPILEEAGELIKVAAELVVEKGLRWREALNNRDSPEYKKQSDRMLRTLQQMFQDTSLSDHMHSIEIDGFVRKPKGKGPRSVIVDYSIYLQKSAEPVDKTQVISIFNDKLINNTFGRYIFDPSLNKVVDVKAFVKIRPTEAPEDIEPPIPQWAIAVIVIGAASFIFIVLFAAVTAYGRHHMRRRYANKLNDDDIERSDDSRDWENRLGTSAYENLAADGIYDGMEDSVGSNRADMKRPKYVPPNPPRNPRMRHYDSWRTEWTEAPKRMRHPVNHIVF